VLQQARGAGLSSGSAFQPKPPASKSIEGEESAMMKTYLRYRPFMALAACASTLLACSLLSVAFPTPTPVPTATSTSVPATAAPQFTPTAAASPTLAATQAPTASPTAEVTATAVSSLRATVLQLSNCRYGPGAGFLYRIGLREGAPVEVIGRTIDGGWAYVQYVGTHNLCWINSKLLQITGDIMSLQDYYPGKAPLPMATKYGPVTITGVSGSGGSVTVNWAPIVLPAYALPGEGEMQYVVEVWTCKSGSPGFYALGTNDTSMTFEVDDSCGQTSHADVVAQNKAGVSGITQIALP
jgi:hypothetical protein